MESEEDKPNLKLYSHWRSSCSFRVRIGLNLKGLKYEYRAVNIVKGEQRNPEFLKLNPIGFVPVLLDGDMVLADSFAILLYLDEKYPQCPLLPTDLRRKAINLQVANIVSSSIQPLQNLETLKSIEEKVGPQEALDWIRSHIGKGFEVPNAQIIMMLLVKFVEFKVKYRLLFATFAALEKLLKDYAGRYATGDEVFLADLFLAPQIYSSLKRFNIDMANFPLLSRLNEEYSQLPAFQDAMPEKQPDNPSITG